LALLAFLLFFFVARFILAFVVFVFSLYHS
jgi:hypothetical protein